MVFHLLVKSEEGGPPVEIGLLDRTGFQELVVIRSAPLTGQESPQHRKKHHVSVPALVRWVFTRVVQHHGVHKTPGSRPPKAWVDPVLVQIGYLHVISTIANNDLCNMDNIFFFIGR